MLGQSPLDEAQGYALRLIQAAMVAEAAVRSIDPFTGKHLPEAELSVAISDLEWEISVVKERYQNWKSTE